MQFDYEISLDIFRRNYVEIESRQYDDLSRKIKILVTKEGEPITIPSGTEFRCEVKKPDGTYVKTGCTAVPESGKTYIIMTLTLNMLAAHGVELIDIVMEHSGQVLGTMSFINRILPAAVQDDDIMSTSEARELVEAMEEAEDLREDIQSADGRLVNLETGLDDLKSALDATEDAAIFFTKLTPKYTSENYAIKQDGHSDGNSNYRIDTYMIVAGTLVKIVADHRFQFQSSENVPSSGDTYRTSPTYDSGEYLIVAPESTICLKISTPKTSTGTEVLQGKPVTDTVTEINDTLSGLYISEDLFNPQTDIATPNAYLNSNGAITHSDAWNVTKFLPINQYNKYKYSGITNAGSAPYSWYYTSDREQIGSFKQAIGDNNLDNIPSNAAFVKFSLNNTDVQNFKFLATPTMSMNDLQDQISDINNLLSDHDLDSFISWQNVREKGIDNSAWSWWTYPQVELETSVRRRAYFGNVSTIGVAGVGSASIDDVTDVAKTNLCFVGKDDHNGMAIYRNKTGTSGQTFMAFGFTHNEDNYIRQYLGADEHNADLYNNPIMIEFPDKTTYAQVFNTKESATYTQNRLLLITRVNITEWWGVYSKTYYGTTWDEPMPIVKADRQYYVMFRETTTDGLLRMVMYSNPNLTRTDTRIRMGFLNMSNGNIYNADGTTLLGSMSTGGVNYTDFDIIIDISGYDETQTADASDELRNRLLDVAITAPDQPYIAYATFTGIDDAEYYVYYNGTTIDVTACGEPFYYPSVYVGGLIFTPQNPNIIYLSRQVNNISRLEKWSYSNGAYSLDSEIDRGDNSMIRVIRPIIDKEGTMIFYQKGTANAGSFARYNYDAKAYKIV